MTPVVWGQSSSPHPLCRLLGCIAVLLLSEEQVVAKASCREAVWTHLMHAYNHSAAAVNSVHNSMHSGDGISQ